MLGGLDLAKELLAAHRIVEIIVASEKIPADRVRALEAVYLLLAKRATGREARPSLAATISRPAS